MNDHDPNRLCPLAATIIGLLWTIPLGGQGSGNPDLQARRDIWQGYFNLENDCKLCHGVQGEGGFAKPLAGHQLNTAQFIAAVREGRGIMPAFVATKISTTGNSAKSRPTWRVCPSRLSFPLCGRRPFRRSPRRRKG